MTWKLVPKETDLDTIIKPNSLTRYSDRFCTAGLTNDSELVNFRTISAVFVLIFSPQGELLVFDNVRGIDIPGGHIQENETLETALIRETQEEIGIDLKEITIKPLAVVTANNSKKYQQRQMWFAYCQLTEPVHPANAYFIDTDTFLKRYKQRRFKGVLTWLVQEAKQLCTQS